MAQQSFMPTKRTRAQELRRLVALRGQVTLAQREKAVAVRDAERWIETVRARKPAK